jgi:hypothetical protein
MWTGPGIFGMAHNSPKCTWRNQTMIERPDCPSKRDVYQQLPGSNLVIQACERFHGSRRSLRFSNLNSHQCHLCFPAPKSDNDLIKPTKDRWCIPLLQINTAHIWTTAHIVVSLGIFDGIISSAPFFCRESVTPGDMATTSGVIVCPPQWIFCWTVTSVIQRHLTVNWIKL